MCRTSAGFFFFLLTTQLLSEEKNSSQLFCQFGHPCTVARGVQAPLGLVAGIFMCHLQLFLMQLKTCNATPYAVLHATRGNC